MTTTSSLSSVLHRFPARRMLAAILLASATVVLVPATQAPAAMLNVGRALNPQPLPPGLRSWNEPRLMSPARTFPAPSARRVCVAWGHVCVKAGQGTKTHPAPCEQFEYVCEKYG